MSALGEDFEHTPMVEAISLFREHLRGDEVFCGSLWALSGRRLVCHCKPTQSCHGNVLIKEFVKSYPSAHSRNDLASEPPSAEVLDFVARLREEPESESDSSPAETLCSWALVALPGNIATDSRSPRQEDGLQSRGSIPRTQHGLQSHLSTKHSRKPLVPSLYWCRWR